MNFSEFYQKYFDKVFNYIYKRILDYEKSLDIIQESFLKLFLSFEKIKSKDEKVLKVYIYKVSASCITDYKRKLKIKPEANIENIEFENGYEENFESFEKVKLAISILEKLPGKYSEVLRLKFVEELENDEIAEILKVKESSVRSLIKRGIEKARSILSISY